ncbi:MAG: hypothetical protein AAGA09_09545, partial [Pseudomonadota bacterium]
SRRNRSKPQKARKAPSTHRRNGGVKAEKLAAHNENATPKADFFNTIGPYATLPLIISMSDYWWCCDRTMIKGPLF